MKNIAKVVSQVRQFSEQLKAVGELTDYLADVDAIERKAKEAEARNKAIDAEVEKSKAALKSVLDDVERARQQIIASEAKAVEIIGAASDKAAAVIREAEDKYQSIVGQARSKKSEIDAAIVSGNAELQKLKEEIENAIANKAAIAKEIDDTKAKLAAFVRS